MKLSQLPDMKHFLISFAAISLLSLSSCISTEEVSSPEAKSETAQLVLNIEKPSELATRADDGYKLRYVAKLFQASSLGNISELKIRKEIADGDFSENEVANQIIFNVDAGYPYIILVTADYIPKGYPISNSTYQDYFYNTACSDSKSVAINPTPGQAVNNWSFAAFKDSFFNNDNYDCFYAISDVINKTEAKVELSLTLNRNVSKIIFKDQSGAPSEGISINISKIGFGYSYELHKNVIQNNFDEPFSPKINLGPSSTQDGLFYFYSFAPDNEDEDNKASITFTVNSKTFTIEDIPLKANYKTIVTGNFLGSESSGSKGEDPSGGDSGNTGGNTGDNNGDNTGGDNTGGGNTGGDTTEPGDIILNLGSNSDWNGYITLSFEPMN